MSQETINTIMINNVEYVRKDSIVHTKKVDGFIIGKKYAFRTVTMIDHGTLVHVGEKEFIIIDACWIADTGRWHSFVSGESTGCDVEMFPAGKEVFVARGALIDAVELDNVFKTK